MFSDRFDSLMCIAKISNSLLGREVNMNPSYIGRLRSGARPLPKKHEYLHKMCCYLAKHLKKESQLDTLQKLTGIGNTAFASTESTALCLEQWLLGETEDTTAATRKLISGFSHFTSEAIPVSADGISENIPQKYVPYLYGNAGKRRAVEQFFAMILQEEKPQTLLLFSDENMAWLYEDAEFAAHWAKLFTKVILKGNRVKIIHTVSRDMNEMLEAVTRWIPIYRSGMVEPYYYPRLKDRIFQHTLFIAPNTAAVVSSSIQQDTDGMLNFFITDHAAVNALAMEYERYFSLCRPLMHIFTPNDAELYQKAIVTLTKTKENAYLSCAMPPLFTMPETLVQEFSKWTEHKALIPHWKHSFSVFQKAIKQQHLSLVLLNPAYALLEPDMLHPSTDTVFSVCNLTYTKEQYEKHIDHLQQMEKQYENLKVYFVSELSDNTLLYIKENQGVVVTKTNTPGTAFIIREQNMIHAFEDYLEKCVLI